MIGVKQTKRLYAYFLREDLYITLVQHTKNQIHATSQTNNFIVPISFFRIKKAITRMRKQHNITILKQGNLSDEYQAILQIINVALVYINKPVFSLYVPSFRNQTYPKQFINNTITGLNQHHTNIYNGMFSKRDVSIHSAFLFLENRYHSCNYLLEDKIHYLIHPEIIIRIIRKYVFDVCLIHCYRIVFYFIMMHLNRSKQTFNYSMDQAILSMRNIYAIEIDSFFADESLKILNQTTYSPIWAPYDRSIFHKCTLYEFHVTFKSVLNRKILKHIIYYSKLSKNKYGLSPIGFYRFGACHYLRCNSIWKFAMQANSNFMYLFGFRYMRFITRRMGAFYFHYVSSVVYDIRSITKHKIVLLGVLVKSDNAVVKIQTQIFQNILPITYLRIQYIRILSPNHLVIKALYKYQLCTSAGYPLHRYSWTTFGNIQIVQRFKVLQHSIIFYYSGCINRKALSYVKQILRYSCAKTLAFKHKTTTRNILSTKIDQNVNILNVFNTKKQFWLSFELNNITLNLRVWHLELFNQYRLMQDD
uniref:Maturase K n=1 Tax=Zygnema circumcarinatum TaxID=35869 RepID=MATK_ZYGCR|nr:putative maturase [Zygnema circumcarinatum]Q32RL3.1 RecName: Full=Maturase K; AltName: Full=Intron maturase [Zygnema circumcarinatum]AAX45885.1 putative maturase [Zygnema circumcarinatum]